MDCCPIPDVPTVTPAITPGPAVPAPPARARRHRGPRRPCSHCGRVTAVVSAAGALARHRCADNPETMTPAERIRLARECEARDRRALVRAHESAVENALLARRIRAVAYPAIVVLLVAGIVATATIGPGEASGALWTALAVLALWSRSAHNRACDAAATAARTVDRLATAWDAALAHLLALEAEHPDDAHPELQSPPLEGRHPR